MQFYWVKKSVFSQTNPNQNYPPPPKEQQNPKENILCTKQKLTTLIQIEASLLHIYSCYVKSRQIEIRWRDFQLCAFLLISFLI